jgi:hypothetical protein
MSWDSRRATPEPDGPDTVEVAFRAVRAYSYNGGIVPPIDTTTVHLLRTQEELTAFQAAAPIAFRPADPPEVDWAREALVVATLGTRPSGCYGVAVERVTRAGTTVTVDLYESRPGRGFAPDVRTHPCAAVAAATAVRWRSTDVPDLGLPGYEPQRLSGAATVIGAHAAALRRLVGRPLTRTWLAWDLARDCWFNDYPVLFDVGGTQLEVLRQNANDLCLTFDSVDPRAPIVPPVSAAGLRLAWRSSPTHELALLAGAELTGVEVLEWTDRSNAGRTGRTALSLRFGDAWLTVDSPASHNGLAFEPPGAHWRRHRL